MKKYLITAIVATSLMLVGYMVYTYVLGLFTSNEFASYIIFFMLLGCVAACITSLVYGIKGIKDKNIRGQSIATIVVSGLGLSCGGIMVFSYTVYIVFSLIR